jgi:hypothetical protein
MAPVREELNPNYTLTLWACGARAARVPASMTAKNGPLPDESAAMSLPSDRAFVVQFAAERRDDGAVRGRVEHLASGRAVRFASWAQLREFLEDRLADAAASGREQRAADDPHRDRSGA